MTLQEQFRQAVKEYNQALDARRYASENFLIYVEKDIESKRELIDALIREAKEQKLTA